MTSKGLNPVAHGEGGGFLACINRLSATTLEPFTHQGFPKFVTSHLNPLDTLRRVDQPVDQAEKGGMVPLKGNL